MLLHSKEEYGMMIEQLLNLNSSNKEEKEIEFEVCFCSRKIFFIT